VSNFTLKKVISQACKYCVIFGKAGLNAEN